MSQNDVSGMPAAGALSHGFRWLRFDEPLESEFQAQHHAEIRARVRVAVLLALLTVSGFAVLDHELLGQPWTFPADVIRFGIHLPIVIVFLLLTSERHYSRYYHPTMNVLGPIFGLGTVIMATTAGPEHAPLLSARLVLVAFFFYFMLGLSFVQALRVNAIVLGGYVGAALYSGLPQEIAAYNAFILLCANLFAGAGSYALERANRLAFLERRRLVEVASHDGLTGLLNRGALEREARRLWDQAVRERAPVAIVMIDIDHFKAYNDRYGHQAGDECLRQVAIAVRGCGRRPTDLIARYGGEEMIAVLPGADLAHAESVAAGLVQAVRDMALPHMASPSSDRISLSVGVAAVDPARESSLEAALRLADRALYMAKHGGRDRWISLTREEERSREAGAPLATVTVLPRPAPTSTPR